MVKKQFKYSKLAYERYLNETAPGFESEQWIIGGKRRKFYAAHGNYGAALRKYDPIAFEVGYQEWVRNNQFKNQ